MPEGPDVLVDVPVVKVDKIDIEVDDLTAQVAVLAKVRKLLNISIGAQVHLGQVELKIEGVEAQALLKARLDNVSKILERVLLSLDRNPELLEGIGKAVEEVGGGTGHLLDESGDAIEDVGEGAGKALPKVGQGASQALGDVGQGANQALGEVGQGANQALGQVGQGAGQGVAGLGQGANQALGQVGQGAGQGLAGVGQGVQQGVGQLTGQQQPQQQQQQQQPQQQQPQQQQRSKDRRSKEEANNGRADTEEVGFLLQAEWFLEFQAERSPRVAADPRTGAARSGGARTASQKTEKYRFAKNVEGEATVAEREYRDYATSPLAETGQDPDVLLDVPVVKVDKIYLKLADLDAHVALKAQVLDLVDLNVGVDVHLGKLEIDIEGVEAQALLKVRLEHVAAVVDRVMTTIDRNPELVHSLSEAVQDIGAGAGDMVGEAGEAVEDVGEGAEQTLPQIGEGAGQAVGEIGEGAGQAVGEIGEGAGQAVEGVGEGAGQAVGEIGEGAGQAVEGVGEGAGQAVEGAGEGAGQAVGNAGQLVGGLGQTVGQLGQGVGEAAGGLGQGAGEAVGGVGEGVGEAAGGVGEAAGQLGQTVGQLGQGADQLGQLAGGGGGENGGGGGESASGNGAGSLTAPKLAKQVAKIAAKEIGSAASDEAKELGLAATKKVKELGERRRERRAEKHHATPAAMRLAQESGIDIDSIDGCGAEGRVVVRDVKGSSGGAMARRSIERNTCGRHRDRRNCTGAPALRFRKQAADRGEVSRHPRGRVRLPHGAREPSGGGRAREDVQGRPGGLDGRRAARRAGSTRTGGADRIQGPRKGPRASKES